MNASSRILASLLIFAGLANFVSTSLAKQKATKAEAKDD